MLPFDFVSGRQMYNCFVMMFGLKFEGKAISREGGFYKILFVMCLEQNYTEINAFTWNSSLEEEQHECLEELLLKQCLKYA